MENEVSLLEESDVRFVIDSKGNKKEVIISYDKFMELMQIIEDHVFLHSPEILGQIKQSEDDIKSGRYVEFDADQVDEMLDWLHSGK
jgi:PHD/YefM family antitoxin component YafN of YafNO toxin-antitoxin module